MNHVQLPPRLTNLIHITLRGGRHGLAWYRANLPCPDPVTFISCASPALSTWAPRCCFGTRAIFTVSLGMLTPLYLTILLQISNLTTYFILPNPYPKKNIIIFFINIKFVYLELGLKCVTHDTWHMTHQYNNSFEYNIWLSLNPQLHTDLQKLVISLSFSSGSLIFLKQSTIAKCSLPIYSIT